MFSEFDRLAMTRALALAERGLETAHPNPRVGCVIAQGERIIAEGWHERAGEAHAEVAALRAAKEPVAGATAYVTLEPCSHYGRTPPCVNVLIEARIARVVFAVQDPNPSVSGQGADALLRAGIAVEAGLMEAEATEINIGFMKRMKHGLPWVRVKLAMSLDGRTALANGASQWITGELARNDVQRWRARCSAVMTGVGTVLADDPQLNVRTVGFKGRQPLRVVLDSRLRSPLGAKMFVGLGAAAVAPAAAVPGASAVPGAAAAGGGAAGANAAAATGVGTGATSGGAVLIFVAGGCGSIPAVDAAPSAASSSADDATWAGAALSGGIPVGQGQAKTPAVATGAPLSGPRSGVTVREPIAPAAAPAAMAATGPAAVLTDTSAAKPDDSRVQRIVGSNPTLSVELAGLRASNVGPSLVPAATGPEIDSPAGFQARRAALAARGVRIEEVTADDGLLDLFAVLQKLAELEVNEVLVEAGPTLAGQLLTTFLADELLLYIAPKLLGPQGRPLVNLPELQSLQDAWGFALFDDKRFGDDLRLRMRPK